MIKEKVLVIDEDRSTRDAINILLELNEIEVVGTDDVTIALAKLARDHFDVILLSSSPSFAAANIIGEIKNSPLHYKTPLIVLLDTANEKELRNAMNQGADDCISKPFQGKVLMAAIRARMDAGKKRQKMLDAEVNEKLFSLLNKNFNQELLTPLNGIVNTTFLVESLPGVEDIDGLSELLTAIYGASFRMLRTTQNLLTYSSLSVDNGPAPVKVSSGLILQDVLQMIVGYYENGMAPGITVIEQQVLQVGSWEGPEDHVRTIFTELVDNAVKFTHKSELPVIKLQAINNAFTLSVTNMLREHTFFTTDDISPFKKFHNDLSRNGLGIGLFTCKSICEKMGYKFTVNKKNDYITFTVECEG